MKYLQLFFLMMAANLKGLLSFKTDFLISFFGGVLSQTIGLLFISVLFYNVPSVANWNAYEVALLYSYILITEGILTLFFQGTNGLWRQIRYGTFDQYFLRPLPIPFQIYSSCINLAGLGTTLTGLFTIFVSLAHLKILLTPYRIFFIIFSLFLGTVVRVNINFTTSLLPILLEGATGLKGMIEKLQEAGKYPLTIYPKAIQLILLSLIPYAAISYIPASILLSKISYIYFLILPISMILIIILRIFLFNIVIEKYSSSGS